MLPVETTGQGVMALPLGISDLLNEVRRYGILNIALDDLECLKYEIMLRKQNGIIKDARSILHDCALRRRKMAVLFPGLL